MRRLRGMLEVYRELALPPDARAHVDEEWQRRKIDYALKYLDSMTQGIREGAERARKIVRDLRVFARSQDDVWQPVDLHEEIESSLTLLNHLLKDRVTVHRKFGDLPQVECIRSAIDQVFLNLLANAAQAIAGHGRHHDRDAPRRRRGGRLDRRHRARHRPGRRRGASSTRSSPRRPWARARGSASASATRS